MSFLLGREPFGADGLSERAWVRGNVRFVGGVLEGVRGCHDAGA